MGEIGIFLNPIMIFALSHAQYSHSVCFLSVKWPDFFSSLKGCHMIMGVFKADPKIYIDM